VAVLVLTAASCGGVEEEWCSGQGIPDDDSFSFFFVFVFSCVSASPHLCLLLLCFFFFFCCRWRWLKIGAKKSTGDGSRRALWVLGCWVVILSNAAGKKQWFFFLCVVLCFCPSSFSFDLLFSVSFLSSFLYLFFFVHLPSPKPPLCFLFFFSLFSLYPPPLSFLCFFIYRQRERGSPCLVLSWCRAGWRGRLLCNSLVAAGHGALSSLHHSDRVRRHGLH